MDAFSATLDVGRHLRRNSQARSAERGRGHAHAHLGRTRMSQRSPAQTLTHVLDGRKTLVGFGTAALRWKGAGQSSLAAPRRETPRKPRTHSAGGTPSLAQATSEQAIVKDSTRRQLFAVADAAVLLRIWQVEENHSECWQTEWTPPGEREGSTFELALDAVQTENRKTRVIWVGRVRSGLLWMARQWVLWWVWPAPNVAPSSGATRRETRGPPRHGPVSCSAVTLRLAHGVRS